MRNTDDPNPSPIRPLGDRVTSRQPSGPEWRPYVDRDGVKHPGVEENSEGKIRTNIPLPKIPRWFPC